MQAPFTLFREVAPETTTAGTSASRKNIKNRAKHSFSKDTIPFRNDSKWSLKQTRTTGQLHSLNSVQQQNNTFVHDSSLNSAGPKDGAKLLFDESPIKVHAYEIAFNFK